MTSAADQPDLIARLSTLGDLARLRLLRLLESNELSVGELSRILQLPQSTVSRHLKLLFEGGWVGKRAEGTASLYHFADDTLEAGAADLWALARRQLGPGTTLREDDARLREVLADRRTDSRAFFGRVGGEWDHLRAQLFGSAFTNEALLDLVDERWTVADLGCGTGNAAERLAPVVRQVIAVDREPAMLEAARKRLAGADNVDFRPGDMTALPIDDASVDAAISMLVLHHLPRPALAVKEIARILRPGGLALIVDMAEHTRAEYRRTMGHEHLGFDRAAVSAWAKAASLTLVRHRRLRPDTDGRGPGLFAAALRRPS
ncbi:MAG: metalloregulator ArsR/SmtB family transcription factor [Phycisphaerales bacterium]|nr:metalloregulator ArsR/SmtB family transcription factor [Phycisphaerales bacterium]